MEGAVPFKQVIEAEGLGADCRFTLRAWTEQLGAAMIDSEEIEIKAGIDLHVLAVERHREAFLAEVEEKEAEEDKKQNPGGEQKDGTDTNDGTNTKENPEGE